MRTFVFGIVMISLLFISARNKDSIPMYGGAIPIIYCGYIYIPGSVDSISGNFLLDTGADNLHLDSLFYDEHQFGYSHFQKGKIWGIGNSYQDAIMIFDTINFRFNSSNYQTSAVLVTSLKPIGGDYVDGLIGLNYFSYNVLELNYQDQYIAFHNSLDSMNLTGYRSINIDTIDGKLYIPLDIKINDETEINGNFMIDVGSDLSTLTNSEAVKSHLETTIDKKVAYYTKYGGVGGASSGYDFIADSMQIGGFSMVNVNMSFSTDTFGIMAADDYAGIIGNNILDHFDVVFDFSNLVLYLKPNKNFDIPYEFDRLGFTYVDRNLTMGGWIVTGLSKGSPAEKSGLKIDDKIVSVNDTSVHEIPLKSQKQFLLQQDSANIHLIRNGKLIKMKFKLKPLLTNK